MKTSLIKSVVLAISIGTPYAYGITDSANGAAEEAVFPAQNDIVRPLLIKKSLMKYGSINHAEPGVVCEPLVINKYDGTPGYYMGVIYFGKNLNDARKWNKTVADLNDNKKVDAQDLLEALDYFSTPSIAADFEPVMLTVYTWQPGVLCAGGVFPNVLLHYEKALAYCEEVSRSKIKYFVRIVAVWFTSAQIFEFEDSNGENYLIYVDSYGNPSIADMVVYDKALADEIIAKKDAQKEYPDKVIANIQYWKNIDDAIADTEAVKELPNNVPGPKPLHVNRLNRDEEKPLLGEGIPILINDWFSSLK